MIVSTGSLSHQQLMGNEQQLMDSHQEMSSGQQCSITGQQLMSNCDLTDSLQQQQQPLPECQLQQYQLPEFATSSDELLRSRQELTLDAVMSRHNYMDDLCPVCNDRVSGYHYGLQTCESCKGIVVTHRISPAEICGVIRYTAKYFCCEFNLL